MKLSQMLTIGLCVVTSSHHAIYADKPSVELRNAQIEVESGGNDNATGDHGNAKGCLQIWQCTVDDVNEVLGTHYKNSDCLGNRTLSVLIYESYINRYATTSRIGHKPTCEDMARIWNGGPLGCFDNGVVDKYGTLAKDLVRRSKLAKQQAKAKQYWLRVEKFMK